MNRTARRHLLAVLEARTTPLFIITYAAPPSADTLQRLLESMTWRRSIVLPPSSTIEIIAPKGAVRVVAGKGGKRRGVRDRLPKLRLVEPKVMPLTVRATYRKVDGKWREEQPS